MTTSPQHRSRRWPWIIGAIAVIAVVSAIIAELSVHHTDASPTPTPTITSRSTEPASTDASPTGCLGGTSRDNAMLLSAQKSAQHTTTGAVELAAALARWTFRHPTASESDANEIAAKVVAPDASSGFKNLGKAVKANQNPSGGAVADGTDFYVTTAPGVWYVDSHQTDKVTVSVGAGYVIGGSVNPQLRTTSTFTLVWEDGGWHVLSGSIDHTTEQLFKIGTPFTGGC